MLKYCLIVCLMAAFLAGCGSEQTVETIADEWMAPVMASQRSVSVELPEDAVAPVLDSDGQQIYFSEDYEIYLENRSAGDLQQTIRYLSGFDKDALTVMKTSQGIFDRYEFVWTCAGEEGQRLGRAVILDDGNYHYCMSALWDAEKASAVSWEKVFDSFTLQ